MLKKIVFFIYFVLHINGLLIAVLVQEFGRAGRDGLRASSTVFFNSSDISSNAKGMSADIKNYCLSTECRRFFLALYFGYNHDSPTNLHDCCDNCSKICKCFDCSEQYTASTLPHSADYCSNVNLLSLKDNLFNDMLVLFNSINSKFVVHGRLRPELYTGLTDLFAKEVCTKAHTYMSSSDLLCDFPFLSTSVVEQIYALIHNAF